MNRFVLCLLSSLLLAAPVLAQSRIGLFVGVDEQEKEGFAPLKFADEDAKELAKAFSKLGFQCAVLIGKDATLTNINQALTRLYSDSQKLNKNDLLVVFFSGHGVQRLVRRESINGPVNREEPFFCPVDAHKNRLDSLLNLNEVLTSISEHSGASNNMILIDACRESADKGVRSGFDGSTIETLPSKLSILSAAQSGQRSFEVEKLKHGLFTYYLLEGLKGEAADRDGLLTFQSLCSYVSNRVEQDSPHLLNVKKEDSQIPNLVANTRGAIVLGRVLSPERKANFLEQPSPTRFWTGQPPDAFVNKLIANPLWQTTEAMAEIFQDDSGTWYAMAVGKYEKAKKLPSEACEMIAHAKYSEVLKGMDLKSIRTLTGTEGVQKTIESATSAHIKPLPAIGVWESKDGMYISVLYGGRIDQ